MQMVKYTSIYYPQNKQETSKNVTHLLMQVYFSEALGKLTDIHNTLYSDFD